MDSARDKCGEHKNASLSYYSYHYFGPNEWTMSLFFPFRLANSAITLWPFFSFQDSSLPHRNSGLRSSHRRHHQDDPADAGVRRREAEAVPPGQPARQGHALLLQVLLLVSREVHEVHQPQRLHHDGGLRKELLLVGEGGLQLAAQKHCEVQD